MKPIALLWTPIQRKLQASELGIHNQASHPSTVFPVEKNQTPGSFTFPNNEPGEIEPLFNAPCSQILDRQIELDVNSEEFVSVNENILRRSININSHTPHE